MTINGQDCNNAQVIAEHFNTFFATIGAQNEAHIRTHQGSHFRDYLIRHTEARFAFHEIHNYETIRIIKNIKLSSSNGHDGISSELLKLISDDISKCITLISENLNKIVRNPIPDKMTINDVNCCDKLVIADNFNSFFASIGEQNARNITEEHVNSSYRDYLTDRTDSQFIFRTIYNNYTIQIIKNIKTSRSIGHDGISSELLKLINNDISACITLIINQSIKSGIFPDILKIAKVTPIYKKDDKKFIKNYRPISVLPVISKVFETVICDQLCEYFSSKNQLCSISMDSEKTHLLNWQL